MIYGTVKAHHGKIVVDSAVGNGTSMTIIIPVHQSRAPIETLAVAPPKPASISGLKLLLAEDETVVRTILARMLRNEGAQLTEVSNRREAVEAVRTDPTSFNIVLLDHRMPVMQGGDAFRAIHAINPALPCFLMSGNLTDTEAAAMLAQGLRGVLGKPFNRDELLNLLNR
jgi:CheY-like chemotaxis protein